MERLSPHPGSHRASHECEPTLPLQGRVKICELTFQIIEERQAHLRILAARCARAVQEFLPSHIRGRRESRVLGAPAAPCATKKHRGRSHRFAGTPGLPCAMVLTVSFVISPVIGLVCHRRRHSLLRQLERQRRGVRTTRLRRPPQAPSSKAPSASIASCPASVTISSRPSVGQDGANMNLIWVDREAKYF